MPMEQDDQEPDSCRSDDTDSPVGPPSANKKLPPPASNALPSTILPNYVNVPKDAVAPDVASDSGPDDIKSGKVIGANLSDESNDDDSCDNHDEERYSRSSMDRIPQR